MKKQLTEMEIREQANDADYFYDVIETLPPPTAITKTKFMAVMSDFWDLYLQRNPNLTTEIIDLMIDISQSE